MRLLALLVALPLTVPPGCFWHAEPTCDGVKEDGAAAVCDGDGGSAPAMGAGFYALCRGAFTGPAETLGEDALKAYCVADTLKCPEGIDAAEAYCLYAQHGPGGRPLLPPAEDFKPAMSPPPAWASELPIWSDGEPMTEMPVAARVPLPPLR